VKRACVGIVFTSGNRSMFIAKPPNKNRSSVDRNLPFLQVSILQAESQTVGHGETSGARVSSALASKITNVTRTCVLFWRVDDLMSTNCLIKFKSLWVKHASQFFASSSTILFKTQEFAW
jgi:hypothetical protein